MKNLRATLVQTSLIWENPAANRAQLDQKLAPLKGQTDLVILPEMFTTGFSMNAPQLAEKMDGESIHWMRQKANKISAAICGSLIIQEDGKYYNRLIWMNPDGTIQYYDKRHLFTLAGEDKVYTAGKNKLIIDYKGWKICPLVCYDLRFPVWSRNVEHYDLLIYIANFPKKRSYAWKSLLIARAIENQVYTVGVNCVGKDGNDIPYSGDSSLVDYVGKMRFQLSEEEGVFTLELNKKEQTLFRERFNFLADQDDFQII